MNYVWYLTFGVTRLIQQAAQWFQYYIFAKLTMIKVPVYLNQYNVTLASHTWERNFSLVLPSYHTLKCTSLLYLLSLPYLPKYSISIMRQIFSLTTVTISFIQFLSSSQVSITNIIDVYTNEGWSNFVVQFMSELWSFYFCLAREKLITVYLLVLGTV